jgi:hypothetical protein
MESLNAAYLVCPVAIIVPGSLHAVYRIPPSSLAFAFGP